jgi:hypothetical protein
MDTMCSVVLTDERTGQQIKTKVSMGLTLVSLEKLDYNYYLPFFVF